MPQPSQTAYLAKRAAVHEAGHAITAWYSIYCAQVNFAKLDGMTGGLVSYSYETDSLRSRWDGISIQLGGIAAESLFFGKVKTGGAEANLNTARAGALTLNKLSTANRMRCPWPKTLLFSGISIEDMFVGSVNARTAFIMNRSFAHARSMIATHSTAFARIHKALGRERYLDTTALARICGPRMTIVRGAR